MKRMNALNAAKGIFLPFLTRKALRTIFQIALATTVSITSTATASVVNPYDILKNPTPTLDYLKLDNGAKSAYEIKIGADSEYRIIPKDFNTSSDITWSQVDSMGDRTIEVRLPNNEVKYYQYSYGSNSYPVYNQNDNIYIANTTRIKILDNTQDPIDTFSGDFISNFATYDGAIVLSHGEIGNITGNFISNSTNFSGGVISNTGHIGNITGTFISNHAGKSSGAIINHGAIGAIAGDFISNSSQTESGGAIHNNGKIDTITGDFISNSSNDSSGGAIHNYGQINNVVGNFISNSSATTAGAYQNDKVTNSIIGNFVDNKAGQAGGAIAVDSYYDTAFNSYSEGIVKLEANFIGNKAISTDEKTQGGAIYARGNIKNIAANFDSNIAKSENNIAQGGAIYRINSVTEVQTQNGDVKNVVGKNIINLENSTINNNSAQSTMAAAQGGAIYNAKAKNDTQENNSFGEYINFKGNNSITNNHAASAQNAAQGGAIYSEIDFKFKLDNSNLIIKDNYTLTKGIKDDNAIYMADKSTLSFDLRNNSTVKLFDNVRGDGGVQSSSPQNPLDNSYKVKITGDSTGTFGLYNTMYNANLEIGNVNLTTIDNRVYTNSSNPIGCQDSYHFNNITLNGNTNFLADVDLANKQMDRLSADSYGDHGDNMLNVIGLNLISDAKENESTTAIYFAQSGLKNNVAFNGVQLPNAKYQNYTAYTPIFKYNLTYDNQNQYDGKGDGGYFVFSKAKGNAADIYNPAVLSAPTFTAAASQAALNETFKYVFEHVDTFTQLPYFERLSQINANRYALVEQQQQYQGYSTDFNYNLGSLHPENNKAAWLRPYTTFESIGLKNGPKVDSISYGNLIGFDGDFKQHKHGWNSLGTAYLGYNGATMSYEGSDTTMNGGLVGFTKTFYRKNFWSATTLTAGANNAITHTMYGREDFTSILAGIGQKTGYNFEFKDGRFIIQPIMLVSYSFINPFDYTNAAGVKIKSDPTHSIQLNPNIRFIANCRNGWQPYAGIGVVWNVLDKSLTTANGIKLPNMSIKPYVEYNLGLQHNWKDTFTAFIQAMARTGGRNGVALTLGFRWAVGREARENNEEL